MCPMNACFSRLWIKTDTVSVILEFIFFKLSSTIGFGKQAVLETYSLSVNFLNSSAQIKAQAESLETYSESITRVCLSSFFHGSSSSEFSIWGIWIIIWEIWLLLSVIGRSRLVSDKTNQKQLQIKTWHKVFVFLSKCTWSGFSKNFSNLVESGKRARRTWLVSVVVTVWNTQDKSSPPWQYGYPHKTVAHFLRFRRSTGKFFLSSSSCHLPTTQIQVWFFADFLIPPPSKANKNVKMNWTKVDPIGLRGKTPVLRPLGLSLHQSYKKIYTSNTSGLSIDFSM